jgi:toxin-antitoxin system PIN domain toxin
MKLLDVNVWLAASWARHRHHEIAKRWLDEQEDDLAFCRVTQMAFLRLVTNPAITGRDALSRRQAWDALDVLLADTRVRFLAEPDTLVPLWKTLSKKDDHDHLLWTDDYLAAFAQAVDAELATLDGVFRARYPAVRVIALLR